MSQNNLISVIIPAYNKSEELRSSLVSLLSQSHQNYEVIIVNDGSTDNTARIIDELKDKFWHKNIRFKIISQNNQGAQNARNRGFLDSKGNYLIFWDADVVASPRMLETMLQALKDNPSASYAYSSFIFGKKKFKLWEFNAEKLKKMPCIHTTSLIKKADFPGQWDNRISRLQDWDLFLTMLFKGKTGIFVPEFLFTVLINNSTMSSWLPKIAYKLPFIKLKQAEKYKQAVEVIKKKHRLNF